MEAGKSIAFKIQLKIALKILLHSLVISSGQYPLEPTTTTLSLELL
jgi:hypothetical protein